MVIVSDSGSDAEAFVNELLMQVVCGNTLITIFANTLRIRYVNYIQTAFVWIKRGLSLSRFYSTSHPFTIIIGQPGIFFILPFTLCRA